MDDLFGDADDISSDEEAKKGSDKEDEEREDGEERTQVKTDIIMAEYTPTLITLSYNL